MATVSTAAATAAAAAAAELPLNGLLALNSRHLAPRTVIILDIGILGFFLAIKGLEKQGGIQPGVSRASLAHGCFNLSHAKGCAESLPKLQLAHEMS